MSVQQPQEAPQDAARVSDYCIADLSLGETFLDGPPHDAFDKLRAGAPVAWQDESQRAISGSAVAIAAPPSPGFWAVTSHGIVSDVSKDVSTFSSHLGGSQMFTAEESALLGMRMMLLNTDPPAHTRLRKLMTPMFLPRAVELLRSSVEQNAAVLADAIVGAGTVDLVETVTRQLPTRVLASMLGMPEEDRDLIPKWSDSLIAGESATITVDAMMATLATVQEVDAYGQEIFADRRANQRDDIVSMLATAEIDGEPMSPEEFCMFWLLLIVAGNETTRNAMSNGVVALQQFGLWKSQSVHVAEGAGFTPKAVDEIVRYVTPVMHFRRTATRDVELGGQQVRAGDKVVLWYGAANRDPSVFERPHDLNLERESNPHLAFGLGAHYCIGNRLGKLQISAMYTELLKRFPRLTLAGDPERIPSAFINGIQHLPVALG